MTTIIPKILLLDDEFRDTARILYSQIIKKGDELDRWDLNNLVHLLQLLWSEPIQVVRFQAAIISKDPSSECTVVSLPKDQNGIGNFRISPVKVACCLFRWPKLTEIRRIASVPWCKVKLNTGNNKICLNPYHYLAKLAHYEFQYVPNITHDIERNDKNQILYSKNSLRKVKYLKHKILKNIEENNVLLSALNSMPPELVESVEIDPSLSLNESILKANENTIIRNIDSQPEYMYNNSIINMEKSDFLSVQNQQSIIPFNIFDPTFQEYANREPDSVTQRIYIATNGLENFIVNDSTENKKRQQHISTVLPKEFQFLNKEYFFQNTNTVHTIYDTPKDMYAMNVNGNS